MNCLTAYQTLPWPVRSPDISSIEHTWDMKGRRLRLPGNIDHLALQLEQIWQELPQETIRVPYYSMPRRVTACIQVRDPNIAKVHDVIRGCGNPLGFPPGHQDWIEAKNDQTTFLQ
ncbi:transposable element Tcb1 transposase [Trichonephila clavipes]|nr:transposable element Tcb1 transposase [Trichonephila clavipes]